MKFCITSRQNKDILEKADEIMVAFKDRQQIIDLGDFNKPIILDLPNNNIDWDELRNYNLLSKNNLVLKLHNYELMKQSKDNEIKFFIDYPLSSFEEVESAIKMGVSYIEVNNNLFFSMDLLETYNVPIRFNPLGTLNIFYDFETSAWVRPEDIDLYSNGVAEFSNLSVEKEKAIYELYSQTKQWPYQLNLLIPHIKTDLLNNLIDEEFGKRRFSCGKRCKIPGKSCHYCDLTLSVANMKDNIKKYKDTIYKK